MKNVKKALLMALCVLMTAVMLCGCGGIESKLVGSWGVEAASSPDFTLYSDGTCKISNEYGTGHWSVVNGNVLKLTDFYGQSETMEIKSVDGNTLEFSNGSKLVKKEASN